MTVINVEKIGSGTDEDPYRPDTDFLNWQFIDEQQNQFIIQILD